MNRDKTSEYSRKRYTAGAMCFMLFVWLGGVQNSTFPVVPEPAPCRVLNNSQ
nr:hypothetical protein [Escherichia coli]